MSRLLLATPCAALASGCLYLNPAYDSPATGSAASTGSSAGEVSGDGVTTTGVTTGGSTVASSSGEATTQGPTTTAPGSGSETTTTTTGTDGTAPGVYTVAPTVATCVLVATPNVPHGGPALCSANADVQNGTELTGLMMIDIAVNLGDGMGRPARSYIRFDVPAEFAGLTVAAATLHVRVADGPPPELPQSGELVLTAGFDGASLELEAPATVLALHPDMGDVVPSQWLHWSIPPEHVLAGAPLTLGLLPTDDFGVELCGAATEGCAPYLELELQ